jgi:hypothetical protein
MQHIECRRGGYDIILLVVAQQIELNIHLLAIALSAQGEMLQNTIVTTFKHLETLLCEVEFRAHTLCRSEEHGVTLRTLLTNNYGYATLNNTRLLGGNCRKTIAQKVGMVESYVGYYAEQR